MKGSITVFLSLSLSVLIMFVLLLTGYAIRNAGKVRFEGAMDLAMNSVLGEFHVKLHERYGLLYVDLSYLEKMPSVKNMEERLEHYMCKNMDGKRDNAAWGILDLEQVQIVEIVTAAQGNGNTLKAQAVSFRQDSGKGETVTYGKALGDGVVITPGKELDNWSALMEEISGMELPVKLNEKGKWEEVPLSNPADSVFALTGSDVLYLCKADVNSIGVGTIQSEAYLSGREIKNMAEAEMKQADTAVFTEYLFDKMGNYGREREDSFLQCQLEYVAMGERSDYENIKAVTEKLLIWRFAVNTAYAFSDADLYRQAMDVAKQLEAVALDESFCVPVTKSILYACAYLESIAEVQSLLQGGKAENAKTGFYTGIEQVMSCTVLQISGQSGYSYEEYLFCLIMQLSEEKRNLRSMDIMEMDIRYLTGNMYFSMDWCAERFTAKASASEKSGKIYDLERCYGYY